MHYVNMSYSDLLNHRQAAFYLRILTSNFLRIKMPVAKGILETLVGSSNETFLTSMIDYHNAYIKKDNPSHKDMLQNNIGHMKRIFNNFEQKADFSNMKTYLDFGCGNGIKSSAIATLLNINANDVYGIDIKKESNITNFIEYDGIIIPNNLSKMKFDLITCFQVLHHIDPEHLDNILNVITSMISNNGFFILKDHDCFSDWMKNLIDIQHIFFEIDTGRKMPVKIYKSKKDWIEIFTNLKLTMITEFTEPNEETGSFHIVFQKIAII